MGLFTWPFRSPDLQASVPKILYMTVIDTVKKNSVKMEKIETKGEDSLEMGRKERIPHSLFTLQVF